MNSERHYPAAFKFASVAMMAFAIWIFHQSQDWMVKIYAIIEFIATLNGWAASENDDNLYGDLFLLNDACCSACFFLTMLDLAQGKYDTFYIYSIFLFFLYFLWNLLLIRSGQAEREDLKKYQICNVSGLIYSVFVLLLQLCKVKSKYLQTAHYVGMAGWIGILAFWFLDVYFVTYKQVNPALSNSEESYPANDIEGSTLNLETGELINKQQSAGTIPLISEKNSINSKKQFSRRRSRKKRKR